MNNNQSPKISEVLGWIAAWAVVFGLLMLAMHFEPLLRG